MKYETYDVHNNKLWCEARGAVGTYQVYLSEGTGRWYLVKNGLQLAWKNFTDAPMHTEIAQKWVCDFERNLQKQIENLNFRMQELGEEQFELCKILWGD